MPEQESKKNTYYLEERAILLGEYDLERVMDSCGHIIRKAIEDLHNERFTGRMYLIISQGTPATLIIEAKRKIST